MDAKKRFFTQEELEIMEEIGVPFALAFFRINGKSKWDRQKAITTPLTQENKSI